MTDFGLAKALDSDEGHTRSNAVMGTPSYMSPEQAFGDTAKVTAAADIYALGAVLYECLTGRPPFRGATVAETLDQVRHREPLAVRQLQPKTPVDLETIAHKCLHKEPAKRYATAEAMADDLSRALDGRPILARPVGPAERAWRWCRRNPVVAALIAAVVTVFLAGGTGTTAMWLRAVEQKNQAEKNFADAEASLRETFAAVNDSFVRVGDDQLLAEPGLLPLRVKLLSASLPYFEGFVAKRRDDPKWRRELAGALHKIAFVGQLTDPPRAAVAKWRQAVDAYEALRRSGDLDEAGSFELAKCYVSMARQEAIASEPTALPHLRIAAALLDNTPPSGREYEAVAARTDVLSRIAALTDDPAEADRLHAAALAQQEDAVARFPDSAALTDLGERRFYRGQTLLDRGRPAPAANELAAALAVFERARAKPARNPTLVPRNLASTLNELGAATLAMPNGDRAAAERHWRRALAVWDALYDRQPATMAFQHGRVRTRRDLAALLDATGRKAEAEELASSAAAGAEAMHRQSPGDPALAMELFTSIKAATEIGARRLTATHPLARPARIAAQAALIGRLIDALTPFIERRNCPPMVYQAIIAQSVERGTLLWSIGWTADADAEWQRAVRLAPPAVKAEVERDRDAVRARK